MALTYSSDENWLILRRTHARLAISPPIMGFGIGAGFRRLTDNILANCHPRHVFYKLAKGDWADLVRRYDSPDTLFYLDPPYFGGENDYGKGMFDRATFAKMADQLASINGAFILSINDTP